MKGERLEPDWVAMFEYAVQLVKEEIPEDGRRITIISMLEFGKQLWKNHGSVSDSVFRAASVGEANKEITQGLKEIRKGTEVE